MQEHTRRTGRLSIPAVCTAQNMKGEQHMFDEEKIDVMLRNSFFTNDEHRKALKDRLSTATGELSLDELEKVAGGTDCSRFELLEFLPPILDD